MHDTAEKDSEKTAALADLATTLFDATKEIHQLPAKDRFLLETAALLHQRAPEEALARRMSGQPEEGQELLAAALARYHGEELPAAPAGAEQRARVLAALLRIAVALQGLSLNLVIASPGRLEIHVEGAEAELERVRAAAGTWSELYEEARLEVIAGPSRGDLSARLLGAPALRPDTPFDQAVRAVLDFFLAEMLEPPAMSPEEAIPFHRMVQGARRVFRMTSEQLDVTEVASIAKHLRWLSKTLRPVRQWHVLVLNVEGFLAFAEGQLAGVEALLETWREERAKATDDLQSALNSARYQEFAAAARALMRSKNAGIFGKGTPRQPLYCILPSMIWEHYQRLRALVLMAPRPILPDLRTIRGQARDLYHLLAQYQSVLGSSGTTCMRAVQGLEESLTFCADLHRTIDAANDYLEGGEKPTAGIRSLIDAQEADRDAWLERWPSLWKGITTARFRRALGRAVAEL
jgi:CHAD domain-containing protein